MNKSTIETVNQKLADLQLAVLPKFSDAKTKFEKAYLVTILECTNYNISKACSISGIARPQLYRMIKRNGLPKRRERANQ